MRRETTIKGASFTGTSDLTIVAPIRKGFVPALDAVTYKTRVKRVLKTLHLGRQTAHEYEFARVLSDAVERVGRIHSIRIAIIEADDRQADDKVVLAVTFDGSWESYIRVIWQKVARSLDLIFCNTEGYVTGWEHSFEEWCVWLRAHQAEAPFLYSPPGLSYQDTQYLRTFERRHRVVVDPRDAQEPVKADLATTRIHLSSAEDTSAQLIEEGTNPGNLGLDEPLTESEAGRPAFGQGMRSLAGLYRLAELHLPETPDGDILHRATSELLREFVLMVDTVEGRAKYQHAIAFAEKRFLDALDWLRDTPPSERKIPVLPGEPNDSEYADVQGGIIETYAGVSDGCMLLLAFDAPRDLGAFLAQVRPTPATTPLVEGDVAVNIAFTLEGLRLAGLSDYEVGALPQEFVQGMERRAGMLGDVRVNHPRHWRLPALNWKDGANATEPGEDDTSPRVDLGSVHLVMQLRLCNATLSTADARTELLKRYADLTAKLPGLRPLSIQWMHHLKTEDGKAREHFGFLDSQSQPVLRESEAGEMYANRIHLGEILLGHDNAADKAPRSMLPGGEQQLLHNGSFLVVRKLRQDIDALEQAVTLAAEDTTPDGATADELRSQRLLLLGKMVGRWPIDHALAGKALADAMSGNDNDFSFEGDEKGLQCPFHAHIRRANPRDETEPEPPGARPARLVRRGMSYGPLYDPKTGDEDTRATARAQERGLVFMAYNASIGEQFEVVQRWLTGGNSSGSYSGQSDPLLGVAEPGRPRYFRFEDRGGTVRVALDGSSRMHDKPRPFVRLEWGMYLFTPSLKALETLAARAIESGKSFAKSWSADRGETEISRLRAVEQSRGAKAAFEEWKAAIEDPSSATEFTAASIWAAIRENHGGVLETPFGVLVASRKLVDKVLHDSDRNLTATGYLPRMNRSFGPLYLGMDAGQIDGKYELESVEVNAAITALVAKKPDFDAAVAEAATVTRETLELLKGNAETWAVGQCQSRWEVNFEAREVIDAVLAHFCTTWFGLSDTDGYFKKGGMRWNWKEGEPPCYPGHFMAPSRYTFQPHPGPEVERVGATHGLAVRCAMTRYLSAFGAGLKAPVARAALDCAAAKKDPTTYPARTLAGVLMGFLPTTDGNMRRVLNEWLNEGTLWALRAAHAIADHGDAEATEALHKRICRKLVDAMQLRAAPELLWRTAAQGHGIGESERDRVAVRAGQIVIASLISATHECMERGIPSLDYAFGGRRVGNAHPTHACPGYGPATAVMFGFFQGLVESGLSLRPGPAPLSFSMEGPVVLPGTCAPPRLPKPARSGYSGPYPTPAKFKTALALTEAIPQPVPLLAVGDSWLVRYLFNIAPSLSAGLEGLRYDCDTEFAKTGRPLAAMAEPGRLALLKKRLILLNGKPTAPRAIVIGGGGNDLVDPPGQGNEHKTRLFGMLKQNATNVTDGVDEAAVGKFVDQDLMRFYREILKVVTTSTTAPILIHAYDYPVPDGRPSDLGPGPWLEPIFKVRNINQNTGAEIMKLLITRLNLMVAEVAKEFPGRVHPLFLNGTFEKQSGYPANFKNFWANELHATSSGYDILASVVRDKLVTLGVK